MMFVLLLFVRAHVFGPVVLVLVLLVLFFEFMNFPEIAGRVPRYPKIA